MRHEHVSEKIICILDRQKRFAMSNEHMDHGLIHVVIKHSYNVIELVLFQIHCTHCQVIGTMQDLHLRLIQELIES